MKQVFGLTIGLICAATAQASTLPDCDLFADATRAQSAIQETMAEHTAWESIENTSSVVSCADTVFDILTKNSLQPSIPSDQGTVPPAAIQGLLKTVVNGICDSVEGFADRVDNQTQNWARDNLPGRRTGQTASGVQQAGAVDLGTLTGPSPWSNATSGTNSSGNSTSGNGRKPRDTKLPPINILPANPTPLQGVPKSAKPASGDKVSPVDIFGPKDGSGE